MSSRKHRLVWESVFGPIPKDEQNRSYEIHHIDGNHNNNKISNLQLVTIQEHYDIHFSQQDWNACRLIALRMNLNPSEISRLSSLAAKTRVENGTHHFLKGGEREDLKGDKNPMRNPEVAKKVSESSKGNPRNGKWKKASVVHDKACKLPMSAKTADIIFYYAMLEDEASIFTAYLLYFAVRLNHIIVGK